MTHDEFLNLVYPFMDGELDETQRREVEVYIESSEEAQAVIEFESEFQNRSRELLNEPCDMVAKGRILAQFRAEAGITDASTAPQPAAAQPAQDGSAFSTFLRKSWQVPVAAGIMFMLAWMGGAFDKAGITSTDIPEDSENASTQLIDVVRVSETDFSNRIAKQSEKHDCRYECVKKSLEGLKGTEFFAPDSKTKREDRRAAFARLASDCMSRSIDLPDLPERFELVGARRTELAFEDKKIEVPHLILMSEEETLSVYVICASQTAEISKGLHEIASAKTKKSCLLGCPQRGVMVRKCNDVWLVLISKMAYKKLKDVAEEI